MGRRALAWALVLYGVAGLVLIIAGAAIGLDTASRIERLATDADGTLAAAVRATDSAAESFANVDVSLSDAQASAETAATLSRDAAGTMRSLALAMQLSVLGAQPLLPLSADFTRSAEQADELGGALDSVAGSLGDTRLDVATLDVELRTLSDRIEALRGSSGASDGDSPPLRLFIGLLLTWLAMPALAALVVGLALLRRPRERVAVVETTAPPDSGPSRPA